jgi:hypothetical protein
MPTRERARSDTVILAECSPREEVALLRRERS